MGNFSEEFSYKLRSVADFWIDIFGEEKDRQATYDALRFIHKLTIELLGIRGIIFLIYMYTHYINLLMTMLWFILAHVGKRKIRNIILRQEYYKSGNK